MSRESSSTDPHPQTIVLCPRKASDFEGELSGIAERLAGAFPDLAVEIRDPLKSPPGALPPEAVEVLTVIWPLAASYAFDQAADLIVGALRRGSEADKDESPVRIVKIYGPTGEVLKTVRIPTEGPDLGDEH